MNFLKKIKSNKGVTGTDVAAAILIMIILSGTIANMFYTIYYNICMIRMNAVAINCAVNILEYTDRIEYEQVDNGIEDELRQIFDIPDEFGVKLQVDKYTNNYYTEKQDIIKILTLTISYSLKDETEQVKIKKLKVKEL